MRSPSRSFEQKAEASPFPHRRSSSRPATDRSASFILNFISIHGLIFGISISILFPFQVRRQGRKGDSPPSPKTNGVGLRGPSGKNGLATEDIEAKISEVNSRLGAHSSFDIANPVIVSIKTSAGMKAQLLEQEIESQLLAEFAPKLVKVVFNDGSSPVETRSSGGPFVSFAVDEGRVAFLK